MHSLTHKVFHEAGITINKCSIFYQISIKLFITKEVWPCNPLQHFLPTSTALDLLSCERSSSVGQKDPYCDPVVSDPPTASFANWGGIFQNWAGAAQHVQENLSPVAAEHVADDFWARLAWLFQQHRATWWKGDHFHSFFIHSFLCAAILNFELHKYTFVLGQEESEPTKVVFSHSWKRNCHLLISCTEQDMCFLKFYKVTPKGLS